MSMPRIVTHCDIQRRTSMDTSTAHTPSVPKVTPRDVRIATWICFFSWTFAVYDFVLFGNLLPVLAKNFGWSSATSTGANTWVTAGTAIVAFAIGPFVDKIGRRKGIIIAVLGAAIASLLTAGVGWVIGLFAGFGFVLLIIIRSLAGLGYAEQAINATYLGEMFAHSYVDPAKARRRGFIYSLVQSGWPVGSVLAAVSISLILPIGGWEWCFIVAVFPAIFILIAGRYLKESPQFSIRREAERLLKSGKADEAHALAKTVGISLTEMSTPAAAAFKGESLRSTLVIGFSFLLSWLGVLAFSILGTSLLTAADGKAIAFDNALAILIISNATAFCGYLFFGWLGDRIGRRNAIGIGWILCGASFWAMLLSPSGNFALIIALYSAGLFFLIGPYAALLFFNAESFPVHTRATGGSLINAAGQVGSIIGGLLITASLAGGMTWTNATFYWGVLPIFASGILIFFARNVDPRKARTD
jgi:MFS family permease